MNRHRYTWSDHNKHKKDIRQERMFSIGEAAIILCVCPETIRRWDRTGKIFCYRTAGGQRRIPKSVVEYLKSLTKEDFPNLPKPPIKTKASPVIKEDFPVIKEASPGRDSQKVGLIRTAWRALSR